MKKNENLWCLGHNYAKILMIMKLYIIFSLLFALNVSANVYSQNTKITMRKNNVTIQNILDEIEVKTEFRFILQDERIDLNRELNVDFENESVPAILDKIFEPGSVKYDVTDKNLIVIEKITQQEARIIKGKVTDQRGISLPGVSIVEKGTSNGGISDVNGEYSIEVRGEILVFSFIGMKSQEIQLNGRDVINVIMSEDATDLNEVVVTALGIKREQKSLGYSTQKISSKTLVETQGVNIATNLTGKVAGLRIQNSTEFDKAPSVKLRGGNPLIVVDGMPTSNVSFSDFSANDIESITVLKGATASALYGSRGRDGAIMITTKKSAKSDGVEVEINNSTMFNAGFLRIPEAQTSYGTGNHGKSNFGGSYVWGDKLDIGRKAVQYDSPTDANGNRVPTELVSRGKDNLKNFLERSYTINSNVSISQKSENGSFRISLTNVHNKGQSPNTKADKYIVSMGGSMNVMDKLKVEAAWNYTQKISPNIPSYGYGRGGSYIYLISVWSGSDFDLRDFKDYWKVKDQRQRWYQSSWYNNPYYIANENISAYQKDINNGHLMATYSVNPNLNLILKSGINTYTGRNKREQALDYNQSGKGYFNKSQSYYMDLNNDMLVTYNKEVGDFKVDALLGGAVNYYQSEGISSYTVNGLSIPTYYSLKASVDPAKTSSSLYRKQTNSLYGKIDLSYKNAIFLGYTARNDWASVLSENERSFFYPSVSLSGLISEFIPMPKAIDYWKIRSSWAVSKKIPGIYAINQEYSFTPNAWDNLHAQYYPSKIRNDNVKPQVDRTFELGTDLKFFKNRLSLDVTYFNKYEYNFITDAVVSYASGFYNKKTNTKEKWTQKGLEASLSGTPIKNDDFEWNSSVNWSFQHWYYEELDPVYTAKNNWISKGGRYDSYVIYDWERDSRGNIIMRNGLPVQSDYKSKIGNSDPDWIWGFTNSFKYKDWSLYVTFDGRVGGLEYSTTEQGMWDAGSHPDSDNKWRYDEVVNGKTNYIADGVKVVSGDVTRDASGKIIEDTRVFAKNDVPVSYQSYAKTYHGYMGNAKYQNIFSETFVKLRELALNYNVPKETAKKMGFSKIALGVIGQNLWMWSKDFKYDDPDSGSGNLPSPSMRYIGFNVKLGL